MRCIQQQGVKPETHPVLNPPLSIQLNRIALVEIGLAAAPHGVVPGLGALRALGQIIGVTTHALPIHLNLIHRLPVAAALVFVIPCYAQLMTKLSPQTNSAFDRYDAKVRSELQQRWQGQRSYLWLDEHAQEKKSVHAGQPVIQPMSDDGSISVPDGVVYDWLGVIFVPGAKVEQVVHVLEDFNKHKDYYPEVIASQTVARNGNTVRGHWRLLKKSAITVVLNADVTARYSQDKRSDWHGESASTKVSEIENPGTAKEHSLPPGEGYGFLWRFTAYWSLEQAPDGVYAECRTLSLSRSIPLALGWAVQPIVKTMPRQSLLSTLEGTRKAVLHSR